MRPFLLILIFVGIADAAVLIDRMAVVVRKHVVKLSDIDRDLRITSFLNREPFREDPASRRKAAERLIDQEMIREELATGGYGRASDAAVDAMVRQIRQSRYGSSEPRLRQALSQYGLTEDQLKAQLLWQLTVLHFIDERFRPGVLVTDEEVKASGKTRNTLEGEQVNQQFETWLGAERKRAKIEFREEAFK